MLLPSQTDAPGAVKVSASDGNGVTVTATVLGNSAEHVAFETSTRYTLDVLSTPVGKSIVVPVPATTPGTSELSALSIS